MAKVNRELLRREISKKVQYPPELRKFAVTLNFFSPEAYNYVRQVVISKFTKILFKGQ